MSGRDHFAISAATIKLACYETKLLLISPTFFLVFIVSSNVICYSHVGSTYKTNRSVFYDVNKYSISHQSRKLLFSLFLLAIVGVKLQPEPSKPEPLQTTPLQTTPPAGCRGPWRLERKQKGNKAIISIFIYISG